MKALEFGRDLTRYAAARAAGAIVAGRGARVGPLRLRDLDPFDPPTADWRQVRPRLAGICGSDLATIDGRSARYFEALVSFPFVPGHEIVGELDDGRRVVVEPVLGCVSRGIDPPCPGCADGRLGNCEHVTFGDVDAGIQTGSCCDTGGGWSTAMVAHRSQLHAVDDDLDDEAAVMIEPTACAVHAALAAGRVEPRRVAVIGAGTLGLTTVAGLRAHHSAVEIIAAAKHPNQVRLADELGADTVVAPSGLERAVRRATGSRAVGTGTVVRLTGGVDVTIDCVGSSRSLDQALSVTRPGGTVVLVGMPGTVTIDLAPLWHREISLVGAYTYGTETLPDGRRARTFELAADLVRSRQLGRLVSATYPLDRYAEALEHAANAGVRGAVKIAFDLRDEKERNHLV